VKYNAAGPFAMSADDTRTIGYRLPGD